MASEYYDLVKEKYDSGKWSQKMLRSLVAAGRITAEEFEEITGEMYAPEQTEEGKTWNGQS